MDDDIPKKKKHDPEELVVQNMMKDEYGRRYIWKHLQNMGVFENMFDSDPIQHAYNAGVRSAGLQLDQDLRDYAPGAYVKMIQENI